MSSMATSIFSATWTSSVASRPDRRRSHRTSQGYAVEDPEFEAGDGFDIASYETATSGVVASLTNSSINTGDAAGDTYILIEGLAGSAFDDTLIGTGAGAPGAQHRSRVAPATTR